MNLGVLVSGNLGYIVLQYLNEYHKIEFVLTDSGSKAIIEFCDQNKLECFAGNPRNGKGFSFCSQKKIDVLLSVNYLFLIEKDLIQLPKILAFNIHGSLLPKYRGRTPHVWAIINNETKTGITAHVIDEGCDTGDIIAQIEIEISAVDTGATVLNKFNENYIRLINTVLERISSNNLVLTKQNNELATFFGKRTPEDGKINWNWQKERINNWVRAQADPYPGAFSFFEGNKIIIDQINYSEVGFNDQMENGLLLSIHPILVKTANGVVELTKTRAFNFELKKGKILE